MNHSSVFHVVRRALAAAPKAIATPLVAATLRWACGRC